MPSKVPARVQYRSLLCCWAVRGFGLPGTAVAPKLGPTQPAVSRAFLRGEHLAEEQGIRLPQAGIAKNHGRPPLQVAHYRVFALDHSHDAELAAATQAALASQGQDAFTTNL